MKYFFAISAMLALSACGDGIPDGMKQKIFSELKDPNSAQFGEPVFFKDRACVPVNAKNAYGGYVGFQNAHLSGSGSYWHLHNMKGPTCSEETLSRLSDIDNKANKAAEELLAIAHKNGAIPKTIVNLWSDGDDLPCVKLARSASSSYKLSLEAEFDGKQQRASEWMSSYNFEQEALTKGECEKAQ